MSMVCLGPAESANVANAKPAKTTASFTFIVGLQTWRRLIPGTEWLHCTAIGVSLAHVGERQCRQQAPRKLEGCRLTLRAYNPRLLPSYLPWSIAWCLVRLEMCLVSSF